MRNLSSLNDLNSLNNLSGLNDIFSLILSKKWLSLMFPSTLAPKWPILASKIQYIIDFLAPFVLEAVEDSDVTFNQIKGS